MDRFVHPQKEEPPGEIVKQKVGFVVGIVAAAAIFILPPSRQMYLPAIRVIARHCEPEVTLRLIEKSRVNSIEEIGLETLDSVLASARQIAVHVPDDFTRSGEKGISLRRGPNGHEQSLGNLIDTQSKALKNVLAIAVLMATWWATEALPLPIVALLPMFLFPLLGIAHFNQAKLPGYFVAFHPYMHRIIVLFFGGFTLAETMKRWHLHERIALHLIRRIGFTPRRITFGMMLATAIISMFISNTATAAMVMPIALAILLKAGCSPGRSRFGTCLMLGIAYAASIGGIGTLIGSPPNVVLAGFAGMLVGVRVTFQSWLAVGLPLVVLLLPLAWWILITLNPPEQEELLGSREAVLNQITSLGSMKGGERNTLIVFLIAAFLWTFHRGFRIGPILIPDLTSLLGISWVDDATIAIAAVLLLYLLPTDLRRWKFTLDWETNRRIPWGTLLLFGGGLAIGQGMEKTGAAEYLALNLVKLKWLPPLLLVGAVIVTSKLLSEVTSNTATTTMLMPILFVMGAAVGMDPMTLMIAGAVSTSLVFMLPVATPPNAIVYGTGYLTMSAMIRNGLVLHVASWVLWTMLLYFVSPYLSHLIRI
jgi:sodium-dependent dicarboxylate transporter 2/3/5